MNDKVVPLHQTQDIVKTIQKNNGVVKCFEYEGEGHGWRQATTIKHALETELAWYREVFGL